jgi:hypothetical protein
MSLPATEATPKHKWTAKIFHVVSEASIDALSTGSGASFGNHELAEEAIQEAAFKLLEPSAIEWGLIDDPGTWNAVLPDGTIAPHEVSITLQEGRGLQRYTADVVLDGKPYRAVAM